MQKTLIANRNMTYATRRLKAGEPFVAPERDARLLVKLGRAAEQPEAIAKATQSNFKIPPPPVVPKAQEPAVTPVAVTTPESEAIPHQAAATSSRGDSLDAVRDEYEKVVGKRWFHGWDEAELRRRIDEHNGNS